MTDETKKLIEAVAALRAEVEYWDADHHPETGLTVRLDHGRTLLAALEAQSLAEVPPFALHDIAVERQRQVEEENWSVEHDDAHGDGSLALAAACYAMFASVSDAAREATNLPASMATTGKPVTGWAAWLEIWPWERKWWRPKDRRRDLIRAGALIVAEIERLDRAKPHQAHSLGGSELKDAPTHLRGASSVGLGEGLTVLLWPHPDHAGAEIAKPVDLQWSGQFSVNDPDPADDHSAIYLQCPNGLLVDFSSDPTPGLDVARVHWIAPTPVHEGPIDEADIPEIVERGKHGEKLTVAERAAWSGYELGWKDGWNDRKPAVHEGDVRENIREAVIRAVRFDDAPRDQDWASILTDAVVALLPLPVATEGWRPISELPSAPTDDTWRILAFCPAQRRPVAELWRRQDYEGGAWAWATPCWAGRGLFVLPEAITHFMPLPAAPAQAEGEGT